MSLGNFGMSQLVIYLLLLSTILAVILEHLQKMDNEREKDKELLRKVQASSMKTKVVYYTPSSWRRWCDFFFPGVDFSQDGYLEDDPGKGGPLELINLGDGRYVFRREKEEDLE